MKRILLDTHALIWWLVDSPKLGQNARNYIANLDNEIYVSAASVWEVSIKMKKGLLNLPEQVFEEIDKTGFTPLAIDFFHSQQAGQLPLIHQDPFDRMLIAQAQAEGLILMTVDEYIPQYGIRVLNAAK